MTILRNWPLEWWLQSQPALSLSLWDSQCKGYKFSLTAVTSLIEEKQRTDHSLWRQKHWEVLQKKKQADSQKVSTSEPQVAEATSLLLVTQPHPGSCHRPRFPTPPASLLRWLTGHNKSKLIKVASWEAGFICLLRTPDTQAVCWEPSFGTPGNLKK